MAKKDLLVRATIATDTGMEADKITNNFAVSWFDADHDGTGDNMVDLHEAFVRFYNIVPEGGLTRISALLSPVINVGANVCDMEIYDITNKGQVAATGEMDPVGSPIWATAWSIDAGVGDPLPSEVAYVVTLEATGRADAQVEAPDAGDFGGAVDRPQQRRTGRIYLGPLSSGAVTTVAGVVRPSSSLRDTARLAFRQLRNDIRAIDVTADLGVWSRKDRVVRAVTHVSMDNSFDTQRRRGEAPTLRTRMDLSGPAV